MDDKQFHILFVDASRDDNRDTFVSDYALSTLWGDELGDTVSDEVFAERIELCGRVWDLAHMSVKDIRQATGLSQARFAERFCIPRRTVEDWEAKGSAPGYVRLMLAELCGLADWL